MFRKHRLNKVAIYRKPTAPSMLRAGLLSSLLLACSGIASVAAEEEVGADLRWFDIEVLVFKQDPGYHSDEEFFPLQVRPIPLTRHYDLLTAERRQRLASGLAAFEQACRAPTYEQRVLDEPQVWQPQLLPLTQLQDNELTSLDTQDWLPVLRNYQVDSKKLDARLELDPLCAIEPSEAIVLSWYQDPTRPIDIGPRDVAKTVIDGAGGEKRLTRSPFLMPESEHELSGLRNQLSRQSGKSPLLHVTWRQPVFNRNQGRKIRLFGGEDFSRDFDYLGFAREHHLTPLEPTDDRHMIAQQAPLERIERLLGLIERGEQLFSRPDVQALGLPERPTDLPANLPQDVWEFDGLMHIYLVGNYLHIDGEFNLREEVSVPLQATSLEAQAEAALNQQEALEPFLKAYYFNQLRRVISHETHYFDHPKFGVVVQIRRTDLSARR